MGVLRRKDTGERFVFVSTHLARNPESLKQQGVRFRQVAQLMRELHTFYKEQNIDTAEVPAIVAGDLNAESLQEVTAVAAAVCGLRDLDVHQICYSSRRMRCRRPSRDCGNGACTRYRALRVEWREVPNAP